MAASDLSFLPMILSSLLHQLPVLITCIVAIVMLSARRPAAPQAVTWALAGFGLTAGASVVMPLAYGALTFVQMRGNLSLGSITWVYPILSFFSSLLHSAGYVLLLVALLRLLRPRAT